MPSSTRSPTRRRLLRSAAALVGVGCVSGCSGTGSSSSESVSNAPNADPPDDAVTDPPMVALRAPREVTMLREGTEDTSTTDESREWRHHLVADADTAASLSIADIDGAAEARRFFDETDFETETVYVERHVVGECYEQRLCWVRWTTDRVETSYARVLRPAEVSCSADARVGVTHLIRLSDALDPEQVSRFSSSGGSEPCRSPSGTGRSESAGEQ
jgi:hypothetical protein